MIPAILKRVDSSSACVSFHAAATLLSYVNIMSPEIITTVRAIARGVARRTRVDADDLNQVGLIAAWQAQDKHDGRIPLAGWCGVCARNAMLTYIRRKVRNPKNNANKPGNVQLNVIDDETGTVWRRLLSEPVAFQDTYISQLITDIERAPMQSSWRDALLTTTIGDVPQSEYARSIGVSVNRVWGMVNRAVEAYHQHAKNTALWHAMRSKRRGCKSIKRGATQ